MKGSYIALMIFGSFGLWQGSVMLSQAIERQVKYQRAREIANQSGKPLLVVGGPLGAKNPLRGIIRIPGHGFGDYCLDLDPEACRDGANLIVADVREIPFPDRFFGCATAMHILEHLPSVNDAIKAVEELYRVADKVIVAAPRKSSLLAWFIPDHFLWVRQDENGIWIEGREEKRLVLVRDEGGVLGEITSGG